MINDMKYKIQYLPRKNEKDLRLYSNTKQLTILIEAVIAMMI